ncbi:MAG: hypothetical protein DWQ07_12820 [Chloroflexi bacterium]|nr:MAG: hypothetical protein DWQ07_12820 [Chloroflexota bacterium]MBL1196922.1 hypothetical protein [Chloroflexota bacterium]NOH14218.1 hypothetical protein [Chloroflexota bacterium]
MAGEIELTGIVKIITELAADDLFFATDKSDTSATPDGTTGVISGLNLLKKLLGELDADGNSIVNVLSEIFDEGAAPATPATGHVVIYAKADGLIYSKDDAGLETLMSGGAGGGTDTSLKAVQVFTAGGTWNKPANLHSVIVEVVGGGGGGGGCGTTAAGEHKGGTGGAGGGYSRKFIAAASLGATETVTVGAGGAGGVGANNGAAGGNSSFGAHCSANGGGFGQTGGTYTTAAMLGGRDGGTATGGDINSRGESGGTLFAQLGQVASGKGGDGPWGGGGKAQVRTTTGINGAAGDGPGAGGAGGANGESQGTARDGGAGDDGIVIVYEFTEL